jgi:diguanylate cyclase (GGDEF)-like protein
MRERGYEMTHPAPFGSASPERSDIHLVDQEEEREEPTLTDLRAADSKSASRPGPRDQFALAVLSGSHSGAILPLRGSDVVIGRSPETSLQIDEPTLSRRHARVFRRDSAAWIEDLKSTNGTFVDGQRLSDPVLLHDGARIALGSNVLLRFFVQDRVEARATLQLYESSVRDPLTDTYNRRYLDERLVAEHSYADRHGIPLAVLMIDIDHFKRVNDRYGHQLGDAVLKVVAESLRRIIRPEDVLARYGGEEFVILARAVDLRGATILAERVRRRIAELPMPQNGPAEITVSVGVAVMNRQRSFPTPAEQLDAADRAMYAAKAQGRNRVVLA